LCRELTAEDFWQLPDYERADQYSRAADAAWEKYRHHKRPLMRALFHGVILPTFYFAKLRLRVAMICFTFVYPFLLKEILTFVAHPETSVRIPQLAPSAIRLTDAVCVRAQGDGHWGFMLAGSISLVAVVQAACVHRYYWCGSISLLLVLLCWLTLLVLLVGGASSARWLCAARASRSSIARCVSFALAPAFLRLVGAPELTCQS
jgi:hypothetical protein